ncbi:uncharacterized protein FA14DRAFT_169817 [Meira miltonrushii]|uniref:Uncharacterized protein n=1 Tax=Meira miltonrushii TaxID=1280837 RepID=A0A316VI10_9BASI|nr:uncharacterized protein FA14DRAFT_169817 [Meira miltonrushii]PWN36894.1 hypothetical protein FA14DRAFT_169817 [Meira miltonrushii]
MGSGKKIWQSPTGKNIQARLENAAHASAQNSKRGPRASPILMTSGNKRAWRKAHSADATRMAVPETADRQRKAQGEVEEEDDHFNLSARKQRLSRAARFGFLSSKAPTMLPNAWNTTVVESLDDVDKAQLKKEYVLNQNRHSKNERLEPLRSSILRLTTSSPKRYAAVRSVLRQVRARLGPDEEGFESQILSGQWSPSRIVEYGCGTGEGLWASASVFRDSTSEGKERLTYEGYDSNVPYLRAAADMVISAKERAAPILQGEKSHDGQEDELADLAKMHISLRTSPTSSNIAAQLSGDRDPSQPAIEPTEGDGTLVLCNHALSNLRSDSARNNLVKSLWSKHPTAEVLAFVENGDERGFACIASAREELLGIGKRYESTEEQPDMTIGNQTFYAENTESNESDEHQQILSDHQECHVVAPCPHDRPCPLLHDFELSESFGEKIGKSSRASSPLFHGANHGMNICAASTRVHNPENTRKTRQTQSDVENAQHCYLVVRRGPRPTFNDRKQFDTDDVREALAAREILRRRADKTKVGILEALRSTKSGTKTEIPVAEEINSEDEAVSSSTLAELGAEMEKGDNQAREELLRILPQIIQNQAGDKTEDIPEALQMAQNVLEQSAQMAEEAQDSVEQEDASAAEESLRLAGAMLEQQRELSNAQEQEIISEGLEQKDIESMRIDAYSWPRLIIPPLKRSGHMTVDACTAQGSIDRFVLPKSLGKQTYQDARKARQGDLLPYPPIEEKPVLWEEIDLESGDESVEGLSQDESPVAMIEVQKIKTVMRRIPAALESQRNTMRPSTKIKSSSKRAGDGKAFIDWPKSSALAIGPDLVANAGMKESNEAIPGLSSSSSSRRQHYKEGGERAIEQLEQSQTYSKRNNRKSSLANFDKEVRDAWAEDDAHAV